MRSGKINKQQIDKNSLVMEILDKSTDAITLFNAKGDVIYANPAVLRIFGHRKGEIRTLDEGIRAVFHDPETRALMTAQWSRNVAIGKPFEDTLQLTGADGKKRWLRFQVTPLRGGYLYVNGSDITEQRLLEDRYRAIFEQAAVSIILLDPKNGAFVDFNDQAHKRLGYTRDEFKGMNISDIATRESLKKIKRHAKIVLAEGTDSVEAQVRTRKEELRDVRLSCTVIPIGEQKLIQCIIQDITETKQAASALRESEEKFRNLAEQSPNMIFINCGGKVVYVNQKSVETLGYTRAEMYSPDFNFLILISPEHHAQTLRNMKIHFKQGKEIPAHEYELVCKRGKRIPAMISTRLISFEGKRAILGIVTDISQMKSVESELQAQKTTLEAKNAALKEVLAQIEEEKLQIRKQVSANAEKLLSPIVQRLRRKVGPLDKRELDMLDSNVRDLSSKFGAELNAGITALSPREMEISNMIKGGLPSKDIAELLHLSPRTVHTHRERIRKKLGLSNKNINLFTHLQSLR